MTSGASGGFGQILGELLQTGIYKRSQGKIVRQTTCVSIWVVVAIGAWRLYYTGSLADFGPQVNYGLPALLLVIGFWLGYRIVNYPVFADFLIAVEAEMNKVSWPSRAELVRSSIVVIILIFGLTVVLFVYDILWHRLLQLLQVIP